MSKAFLVCECSYSDALALNRVSTVAVEGEAQLVFVILVGAHVVGAVGALCIAALPKQVVVSLSENLRLKRQDVPRTRRDAVRVEDLLVQARLWATLRPASAIEGLLGGLALVVEAVGPVDEVADGEALGAAVLDDQHFVYVQVWHDLWLLRHQGWSSL